MCFTFRGISKSEIARKMGCSRKTVGKILSEKVEKVYHRNPTGSLVDMFQDNIFGWFDQNVPVGRMLELAREDTDHPYSGGKTIVYNRVKEFRNQASRETYIDTFRPKFREQPG